MFFSNQDEKNKDYYEQLLKIVTSLSKLSSDSIEAPYLYYRIAEKIFCRAFEAHDLSRSDMSIDASKGKLGIGIKTFLHKNGSSFQKIAEFNKFMANEIDNIENFHVDTLIKKICESRNKRLEITSSTFDIDIDNMLYHCISRCKNILYIYETPIKLINIKKVHIKENKNGVISFEDDYSQYKFHRTKSTLFKKFKITPLHKIEVAILENPFEVLEFIYKEKNIFNSRLTNNTIIDTIILPLYSYKDRKPIVNPKSALNQWNASGRKRNYNEVYIPIPALIRKNFIGFFPDREEPFTLTLPNTQSIIVKICQDNEKALMSNPNSALGEWLLRKILKLKEGELLTYEKLEEIGIDSVEITKFRDNTFSINFKKLGSYENFKEKLSKI